jgi:dihydropyrimidinase
MGTVIRGGMVVNADGRRQADVRIEGERVVAVGLSVIQAGDDLLDATDCYVMPGGIDPHTHIEMPAGDLGYNADDWYSGTAAAVAGGTTCVIDMITPDRGGTLQGALSDWQRRAAGKAVTDYGFHMGVIEARDEVLNEMKMIVAAGVPSFKLYLAYKDRLMVDDGAAYQIMREAGRLGAWSLVHAENGDLIDRLIKEARAAGRLHAGVHPTCRPPIGEGEATNRALALARLADAPVYIVHVSCQEALGAIRRARQDGQVVGAEACTHHLILTDREYERTGFAAAPYVMSPPLRSPAHLQALWRGLDEGALDLVATDHCPWNVGGQKDRGKDDFSQIPNGGPGIEERMALLWTFGVASGRWTPESFVAHTSARAAALFGLTTKGEVKVGFDADIIVWDPQVKRTLTAQTAHSRVDHSMYEGMPVVGQARYVTNRGKVVALEGKPLACAGWGRFLHRTRRKT